MFAYLPRKYLVIGIKLEILLEYRCNTKTGITNKGWNCTPNDDDNAEICALRHIIVECVRNRGERRIVLRFALYSWILVIFICQINEFRFSLLLWWRCERGGMNITWRGRAISVRECVCLYRFGILIEMYQTIEIERLRWLWKEGTDCFRYVIFLNGLCIRTVFFFVMGTFFHETTWHTCCHSHRKLECKEQRQIWACCF